MDIEMVKKQFPEHKEILARCGGYKPRKFIQAISIVPCPAPFNPSAQGDCAFTHSFLVENGKITPGPAYSYDTMLVSHVNPYERTVDVKPNQRVWVCTYDGMWGGFWHTVNVYVHRNMITQLNPENTLAVTR